MAVLEVLVWLLLGAAVALGKLVLAPPGSGRWPPGWPNLLLLGAVAAFAGGLLGWFLVWPRSLGEQNIASIMLAATAAAVALLVREAIAERRIR